MLIKYLHLNTTFKSHNQSDWVTNYFVIDRMLVCVFLLISPGNNNTTKHISFYRMGMRFVLLWSCLAIISNYSVFKLSIRLFFFLLVSVWMSTLSNCDLCERHRSRYNGIHDFFFCSTLRFVQIFFFVLLYCNALYLILSFIAHCAEFCRFQIDRSIFIYYYIRIHNVHNVQYT